MSKWRDVFISTNTGNSIKAVTIRLINPTCRNRPAYKLVACQGPGVRYSYDDKREASIIEEVGYFDDCVNSSGKRVCLLDIAKIRKYIAQGAEPTIPVWKLLGASGAFPVHPKVYSTAVKNQYLQSLVPMKEDDLSVVDYPEKYEFGETDMKVKAMLDEDDDKKAKILEKHLRLLQTEDRENKTQGKIKIGDFQHMLNQTKSIEECSPLQRRALEQKYVESYWKLNHYDENGKGPHSNYNSPGYKHDEIMQLRKQYGYWTKGVRSLGYTDPFKFRVKPEIHREGENEQLLEEIKPQ